MPGSATRLVRMLDELGRISDERDRLTRTFLSPAMRRANAQVAAWMREAGLEVREDGVGNVIGRLEPSRPSTRRAKTLLLGSHLDTVRNAGRFDGALGVLLPIVALGDLRKAGTPLPFAIEVIGFSEEEGVRFSSAYLGSKGFTGQLRKSDLALRDADGVSVGEALRAWLPAARPRFGKGARQGASKLGPTSRQDVIGYCEVHIEQGPVLEAEDLGLGVVSAIAGQTRGRLTFKGKAGHAGTTPMPLRRDALAAAAETILFAEALALAEPPLVATVGTLSIPSAASNVIPGEAILSLDVRHPRDGLRKQAVGQILRRAQTIARRRRLACAWQQTQDNPAVACSRELTAALAASVRTVQRRSVSLVSGAGHDAVIMSALAPVAMLFVRCRDGLSHHPDEYAAPRDLGAALDVLTDFLSRLANTFRA